MKRHAVLIEALLIVLLTITSGYSYYNPSQGRWLSRDPIKEKGFQSVFSMPNNNTIEKSSVIQGSRKLESPQPNQRVIDKLDFDALEDIETLISSANRYLSKMRFNISRLSSIGQGFLAQQLQHDARQLEQDINWLRQRSLSEQENLYAFVRNSPVDSLDPLGLMTDDVCMDKCDEVAKSLPCPDMWLKRCYTWCLVRGGPPPVPFPWPFP